MTQEVAVRALIGWGVNIVALLAIDWLFDSVEIGRWGSILLGAAVLGLANAFLKPVLTILTLPLILITLGLFYFALNIAMLALAELRHRRLLDVRRCDDRRLARELGAELALRRHDARPPLAGLLGTQGGRVPLGTGLLP